MQLLKEQKMLMKAGHLNQMNGISRNLHLGSEMDKFILSRKSNFVSELIFN